MKRTRWNAVYQQLKAQEKKKAAADELAPERNAITPKDLKFLTGVAIATETVTSIVVSLTTWRIVLKGESP